MIFAHDLLRSDAAEIGRLRRHPEEDIFGIQLTGTPDELRRCARLLHALPGFSFDFIDLNAGCPQEVAVNKRCGFSIAQGRRIRACLAELYVACHPFHTPVGVKTRIGDFNGESRLEALFDRDLVDGTAELITLHGRTARQRY